MRTEITINDLVANGSIIDPAIIAIDQANGMVCAIKGQHGRLILRVKNTADAAKAVTIKADVEPFGFEASLGDLTVLVGAGATELIGPFTPGRFAQSDNSLHVDFAAGTTGAITAFKIPRRF